MSVGSDEARAERLTHNQALFWDINERVEELLDRAASTTAREESLCECASDACTEHIAITLEQYREVRATPGTFAVAPDDAHVFADIERITAQNDGYRVVEKQGTAAQIAKEEFERRGRRDGGSRHA
jgi:hypothetical protein